MAAFLVVATGGAAWRNGSTPANFCPKCKAITSGKFEKITGDRPPIPAIKATKKAPAKPAPKAPALAGPATAAKKKATPKA